MRTIRRRTLLTAVLASAALAAVPSAAGAWDVMTPPDPCDPVPWGMEQVNGGPVSHDRCLELYRASVEHYAAGAGMAPADLEEALWANRVMGIDRGSDLYNRLADQLPDLATQYVHYTGTLFYTTIFDVAEPTTPEQARATIAAYMNDNVLRDPTLTEAFMRHVAFGPAPWSKARAMEVKGELESRFAEMGVQHVAYINVNNDDDLTTMTPSPSPFVTVNLDEGTPEDEVAAVEQAVAPYAPIARVHVLTPADIADPLVATVPARAGVRIVSARLLRARPGALRTFRLRVTGNTPVARIKVRVLDRRGAVVRAFTRTVRTHRPVEVRVGHLRPGERVNVRLV